MAHGTFTNVANAEVRTCGSYLGSEDGLSDGWWDRDEVVCNANATILYTMKSGMENYLCAHHALRYLPSQ